MRGSRGIPTLPGHKVEVSPWFPWEITVIHLKPPASWREPSATANICLAKGSWLISCVWTHVSLVNTTMRSSASEWSSELKCNGMPLDFTWPLVHISSNKLKAKRQWDHYWGARETDGGDTWWRNWIKRPETCGLGQRFSKWAHSGRDKKKTQS